MKEDSPFIQASRLKELDVGMPSGKRNFVDPGPADLPRESGLGEAPLAVIALDEFCVRRDAM